MSCNWNRRQWLAGLVQAVALLWSWEAAGRGSAKPAQKGVPSVVPDDAEWFTTVTVYDTEGRVVSVTDLQARDTNRSFDR